MIWHHLYNNTKSLKFNENFLWIYNLQLLLIQARKATCNAKYQIFNFSPPGINQLKVTIETLEQGAKIFKVNNKDTRTTSPERRRSVVFINFVHNSHLFVTFYDFEQVHAIYSVKTKRKTIIHFRNNSIMVVQMSK